MNDDDATPMLPHVRVGGMADEREVYRLLLLANAENALMRHDLNKVRYFVLRFLNSDKLPLDNEPRGVFGVIGPVGGKLEGLIMIGLGCFWYSSDRHLEEYLIYVDPEHRRGSVGRARALTEWAKGQAIKTKLPLVTGILVNDRTAAKVRLYRRIFGGNAGEYFIYPRKWASEEQTGPGRRTGAVVVSSSKAA